jgi:hypothetical protein
VTPFEVHGPYDVPFYRGNAGRIVQAEGKQRFFKTHAAFANRVGCYVFGMRAGRGVTPVYVGKTRKNFGAECFEPHKLGKYNQCLADYERGTPILYLLVLPVKRGPRNEAHIKELESFLIQTGVAVNPDLLNVRGTKRADWGITGVLRSGKGRPSDAAAGFRGMMGL